MGFANWVAAAGVIVAVLSLVASTWFSKKQSDVATEANRIALASNPPEREPWGDAEWVKGHRFVIRNRSARIAVVTGLHASNRELDKLMRFDDELPFPCEPGNVISYLAIGTLQTGTPKTAIEWHWDGSEEPRTAIRPNIKP